MRHTSIVGIIALMLMMFSGLIFAEHAINDSKNPAYLLVISGTSGSLVGNTLTLNGVSNVIYFSDRPNRVAGHMSIAKFTEAWSQGADSFKKDPPNATLSVLTKTGIKINCYWTRILSLQLNVVPETLSIYIPTLTSCGNLILVFIPVL